MNRLTVSYCVSQRYIKVVGASCPIVAGAGLLFAVFDVSKNQEKFRGIVTSKEINLHPLWDFNRLLSLCYQGKTRRSTSVRWALKRMRKEHVSHLAVINHGGAFVGIVKKSDLLLVLKQHEGMLNDPPSLHQEKHQGGMTKSLPQQIYYIKLHDVLTGFANFQFARDKIAEWVASSGDNTNFAVMILNIDDFSVLNNALTSDGADQILHNISQILLKHSLPEDIVARKAGDEFIMVFRFRSRGEVALRAKRLLHLIAEPKIIKGLKISVGASIGIALYPEQAKTSEELLSFSSTAMNLAKKLGKNGYQFFEKRIGDEEYYLHMVQLMLPFALERQQLYICYQPEVDLKQERIVGMEALLRWEHPTLGTIAPSFFIPLAEQFGHIIAIEEWMFTEVCTQVQRWQQSHGPLSVSINVGARRLDSKESIIGALKRGLSKSGFAPQLLELELTESHMLMHHEIVQQTMNALRQIGVRIACDDFGVGYSSFSRLKDIAMHTLKIDKSLVEGVTNNLVDLSIVRAIIAMAQQLSIKTVAEGVETKDQAELLKILECDYAQGYYYSKGLKAAEFEQLLKKLGPELKIKK